MKMFRHKYFSVDVLCYKYFITMQSVVKNNWDGSFTDFRDLNKKNRLGRSGLILLQALALFFAIRYSWRLSKNYQKIKNLRKTFPKNLRKLGKNSPIYLMDFTNVFYTDIFVSFSLINVCLPCR